MSANRRHRRGRVVGAEVIKRRWGPWFNGRTFRHDVPITTTHTVGVSCFFHDDPDDLSDSPRSTVTSGTDPQR